MIIYGMHDLLTLGSNIAPMVSWMNIWMREHGIWIKNIKENPKLALHEQNPKRNYQAEAKNMQKT